MMWCITDLSDVGSVVVYLYYRDKSGGITPEDKVVYYGYVGCWISSCIFVLQRQSGGITPEDEVAYFGFLNMLDEVLLPSMSMLPCNCCLSEELWAFLKLFPYELR
jgi:hypothetical protein